MIYAIEAVGSEFIKFGVSGFQSPGHRLGQLQTGCPYELVVRATASWPDREEFRIHRYLQELHVRGEWFRFGPRTYAVLEAMDGRNINGWFQLLDAEAPKRLRRALNFRIATIPKKPLEST